MAAVDNEFDEMAEGLWGGHREDGGPRRRRQHHRCRPQPHRHFLRRTARHDGFGRILTPAARSLGIGQSHQPVCGLQIRSAPVPADAQELLDGREDLRDPAAERFRAREIFAPRLARLMMAMRVCSVFLGMGAANRLSVAIGRKDRRMAERCISVRVHRPISSWSWSERSRYACADSVINPFLALPRSDRRAPLSMAPGSAGHRALMSRCSPGIRRSNSAGTPSGRARGSPTTCSAQACRASSAISCCPAPPTCLTGFNHSGFAAIAAMTIAQPHREHHSVRWGPQGCQSAREVSRRARSNCRHMVRGPARGKRPALLLVPARVLRGIFVLRLVRLSLREPRIATYSPPVVHMMELQSPVMLLPLHFRDRGHGRRYGHHLGLTWDSRTFSLMPALMLPHAFGFLGITLARPISDVCATLLDLSLWGRIVRRTKRTEARKKPPRRRKADGDDGTAV